MQDSVMLISAAAGLVSAIVLVLVLVKLGRLASVMESRAGGGLNFSAADLGAELAGPIQTAFKDHEKSALGALETARKALDDASGKLGGALSAHAQQVEKIDGASRDQLKAVLAQHIDGLTKHLQQQEKGASAQADQLKAALAQHIDGLAKHLQQQEKGASAQADQIKAVLAQHIDGLAKHLQQQEKGASAQADQLKSLLNQHVEGMGKAANAIAGQLDKIMQLEKEIQQVLHVQQVVDGSIKAVSGAEEFKSTLASLRKHLEQSDSLIREATKPRTIRLVEQES